MSRHGRSDEWSATPDAAATSGSSCSWVGETSVTDDWDRRRRTASSALRVSTYDWVESGANSSDSEFMQ